MKKLCIIIILLMAAWPVRAQERNGIPRIVQLTTPGAEAVLTITHPRGKCDIVGYSGNAVILKAWNRLGVGDESVLNKIDFSEKNNRISLFIQSDERIDVEIRVPRRCSVNIDKGDGNTTVRYITGEISVTQQNGTIDVTHLSGTAILNTIDGDINVRFESVSPRTPMAITSFSGDIDVVMPEVTATLKIRSDEGTVKSEFHMEPDSESVETNLQPWRFSYVKGGGPELLIRTVQGNIHIRKGSM